MLSMLTLSISKQQPSKGQFAARAKLTTSSQSQQERLSVSVGSQHDAQSQWVLRTNSPVCNHRGNGPWCSTYRGFPQVQRETVLSHSHSIWSSTFSCYRSRLLRSTLESSLSPMLFSWGPTAYFPRVLQPSQGWRRKNGVSSSWMPFCEQLFGNCRERKFGKDFQYFLLKACLRNSVWWEVTELCLFH